MRRFFAFLMCISGFSLAVTYTHADEPAATPIAEPADAPAVSEAEIPQTLPSDPVPEATDPAAETQKALQEMMARWRELYRERINDEELQAELKASMRQLERLGNESRRIAEQYAGQALEQARATMDERIARHKKLLEEAEENSVRQAEAASESRDGHSPDAGNERRGRGVPMPRRPETSIESHLSSLRRLAEQLEQSAGEETDQARAAVERQIDQLERILAERREHRDAVAQPATAEMVDTERRLAALKLAIRSLKQARFDKQADELLPELEKLEAQAQAYRQQRAAARETLQREAQESKPRLHIEQRREAGAFSEVRELAEDVRQLRRELRRLRADVEKLQTQHAPSATDEASDEKSPDRETE